METFLPDEEATRRLGADLIRRLVPGDVVLLFGELGAGKTTLVRGALEALGHSAHVRSPTFNLIQTFETKPPLLHADLFRLENPVEFGLAEAMEGHVSFIEWPDRLPELLHWPGAWHVHLLILQNGRNARIEQAARAPGT